MTDDRDPILQSLFAAAEQDLEGELFTARVMTRTWKPGKAAVFGWICLGLALVACGWLLAAPLQDAVNLLNRGLAKPLIDLDNRWLMQVLAPLNSVAIIVALLLIGLRGVYRKIFP